MMIETTIQVPAPRRCVRELVNQERQLRNEASVAWHRANYGRARKLAMRADAVARRIREASGHA
jgi:hypothetical protein